MAGDTVSPRSLTLSLPTIKMVAMAIQILSIFRPISRWAEEEHEQRFRRNKRHTDSADKYSAVVLTTSHVFVVVILVEIQS
jgi:uncharacterized membrane protein YidH (DUF202 family)